MSKERQGTAEIQTTADLSSILNKKSEGIYLLPGARRELPPQFDLQERSLRFVTLSKHKEIIEYSRSDQVISLGLGLTVGEVMEITGENSESRQFLPFSADPQSTLFDVVNSADGGLWEHSFGGPRDLVLGTRTILADGRTINTGGKVVKNVTGYDTTKIFVGGRMHFGVPVAAHFRLYARPEWTHRIDVTTGSVFDLLDLAGTYMQSDIPITSLAIAGSQDSGAKMLVELSGHKVVVDELVKPLKDMTPRSFGWVENACEFQASRQDGLNYCQLTADAIEISACVSQMRLLFYMLKDVLPARTELKLRPGTGRFAICSTTEEEKNTILDHLRLALESKQMSLVAAYRDQSFERRIEHLGTVADGSSNGAIIRSLKVQFDKNRIFNPLMRW